MSEVIEAQGYGMLTMEYVNWRGQKSVRTITPRSLRVGSTQWHPEPQWLLRAWDHDKGAEREFALADCDFRQNDE